MPEGIPVGCMGVSSAANAALYAVQILGLKYPVLAKKITAYRNKQAKAVKDFNENKKNPR
jgi:5-(carboxyamino)imidazole ribonucleotide mutase